MNKTIFRKIAMIGLLSIIAYSCTQNELEEINKIQVPYQPLSGVDSIGYKKVPTDKKRTILDLDEPSSVVVDHSKRQFKINQMLQISNASDKEFRLTNYAAQTIRNIDIYVFIEEINKYICIANLDSIPRFAQIEFKPAFVDKDAVYKTEDGQYVSLNKPIVDCLRMKPKVVSEDPHYRMLQRITAEWTIRFSNYTWSLENPDGNWREMRAIYAREWIAIAANYAYMMTTPEYDFIVSHFSEVMGGELHDNNGVVFTPEKYLSEKARFL